MDFKPFDHQKTGLSRFKDKAYGAIFWEPGCGKTKTMIDILEHKCMTEEIDAALVITTKGLMLNWAEVELPKHSTIQYETQVWKPDPLKITNVMYYFIVNIDALIGATFPDALKEFMRAYPKFALVLDESTVAKNMKAKRTKMVLRIAGRAKVRFIMSGTPVTDSPMDLYSQCEILAPRLLGYNSIYAFKADYAIIKRMKFGSRTFDVVAGYRNLDQLRESLLPFASVVKKADCLDLPPKVYRTIHVPFTTEQTEAYNDLRTKAIAWIQDHEVTALNAVGLINRLLQICAGQIKLATGNYVSIPNNRISTLTELVFEADKTIVWTSFVNTATDIMAALEKNAIHLYSGQGINERQTTINAFKKSKVTPFALVANPASAGHGITLTESHNVIYYSNSWSLEHRLQSEFRTDRIGQTESVLYTDLITKGTVEERVVEMLTTKRNIADTIITSNPKQFLKEILL